MSQSGLESFGAYQKARRLFELVVTDMEILKQIGDCTAEALRTRRKKLLINIARHSVNSVPLW